MENTEEKTSKVIVAELTQDEHKALMQLLVLNLSHNQSTLTELRFMPVPACTCGKCENDNPEFAAEHAKMLESLERGVKILVSITEKLK